MADYKVPVISLTSPPAKGDMIYFNGTDWVILPAGSVNPTNLLSNGNFENWSAGTAVAPDGWTLDSGTIASEGTIKLINSYSAKLTRVGTNNLLTQDIQGTKGYTYFRGKTLTFGCWVYATVADRARLRLSDGTQATYSSLHTGNSTWQWLTATITVDVSATNIYVQCGIVTGDTSAYFDGAICVEGSSIFAYADKPFLSRNVVGEIVALTTKTNLVDNDSFLIEDSEVSYAKKKSRWVGIKSTLKTYFDGIYIMTKYGVSWDESADTYARTGATLGQPVGQTLSTPYLPIQRSMRRCVVLDNGTVNYYLGATDSTKKEDMITASNLTGADGQVMVEIPKFYYKHSYSGTTHTWEISPILIPEFSVHPAFLSGATELNYVYVGAYEGILWDATDSLYKDYAAGQTIDPAADKISSVTGKKPVTNHTRANFRLMANRRGTGWTGMLYDILSAVQLLYLIEYASFYSQSVIGAGISNVTDWAAYNNYYPITPSGNSNNIGNASGNTAGSASCATEASKYMSYRGIENWYGHIWKWLDGINTNSNRSYICNVIANLADDTTSNYTDIGVNNINASGYQATLLNITRGFLPAAVGADGATKITDYYYQDSGWRVAASGGAAPDGAFDGGFCLVLFYASAVSASAVGGRLCFRK